EEIGAGFPGLVKSFLEQGGSELPPIPGLKEQVAKDLTQAAQAAGPNAGPSGTPKPGLTPLYERDSLFARLARDPVGNSMAVAMLAAMLFVCGRVALSLRRSTQKTLCAGRDWF